MFLPLLGYRAGLTDKLPVRSLGVRSELQNESVGIDSDIFDALEGKLCLELGEAGPVVEGEVDMFGNAPSVGDGLVGDEQKEALVGEEEALVLLPEQPVDVAPALDGVLVGLLLDLLLKLLAYQSPPLTLILFHFTYYNITHLLNPLRATPVPTGLAGI